MTWMFCSPGSKKLQKPISSLPIIRVHSKPITFWKSLYNYGNPMHTVLLCWKTIELCIHLYLLGVGITELTTSVCSMLRPGAPYEDCTEPLNLSDDALHLVFRSFGQRSVDPETIRAAHPG